MYNFYEVEYVLYFMFLLNTTKCNTHLPIWITTNKRIDACLCSPTSNASFGERYARNGHKRCERSSTAEPKRAADLRMRTWNHCIHF